MTVDAFYRDVARIALTVAGKHGFVLGGGVAWLVNGLAGIWIGSTTPGSPCTASPPAGSPTCAAPWPSGHVE